MIAKLWHWFVSKKISRVVGQRWRVISHGLARWVFSGVFL